MNLRHILLGAGLVLLAANAAEARSAKRGVCAKFTFASEIELLEPGVCWWYNWGNTPGAGYKGEVAAYEGDFEFIPMCWNASYSADNIREYCKAHPEVKYLLGFNEPNFTNQANMTPEAAAARWPEVQALAKELGLQLVAPALNYSPNPPYQDPLRWMDEFVALVGKDAFDFTAIHNYGGFGVMQTLGTQFHERYGKPVWVTEWCNWPGGAGDVFVAPATQISSMVECLEWLEQTPWIHRYSWFMAQGPHDTANKPNYGLLINNRGDVSLSDQGEVYVNLWDFDPEYRHPVGERICAADYHARTYAMVGACAAPDAPKSIEISSFSGGATLDYQFDIHESGDYMLELTVSGIGEPSRFNPCISIVSVNADGTDGTVLSAARRFALPGADDSYTTESFAVSLPAGPQTIRLKDEAPYQPSGIRISALRITSAAGIDGILAGSDTANSPVDVYNASGIRIRSAVKASDATAGLPSGLYIAGGKKVFVK